LDDALFIKWESLDKQDTAKFVENTELNLYARQNQGYGLFKSVTPVSAQKDKFQARVQKLAIQERKCLKHSMSDTRKNMLPTEI